jgi:Putative peptidoglycan binding domain/Papain-like cysteine protease AvrRpt2
MPLQSMRFKGILQLENAQTNSPAVVRGAVGDGVRAIQQSLFDLDYPMDDSFAVYGSPDGVFGKETQRRVIEFQEDFMLVRDGKVGKNTINKLDDQFRSEHVPPKVAPIPVIDYRVPGAIRRTNQRHWFGGASLCWAAALTMMFEYRDQREHNTRDLLDGVGWKFRVLFESNMVMQAGLWGELIRSAGMQASTPTSMTPRDWEKLLRTHGLLWVGAMSGLDKSAFGHSFILYGLQPGPTGEQHVRMINPDGARNWDIEYSRFNSAYEQAQTANYPQVRYFPYGG